jgi:hypothetical protein
VGHYGGRGMMAAAMVHRVFMICKHGCCLLCFRCTDSYIEKGGQLKIGKFPFFTASRQGRGYWHNEVGQGLKVDPLC